MMPKATKAAVSKISSPLIAHWTQTVLAGCEEVAHGLGTYWVADPPLLKMAGL
jgi:hypothetical protein